MSERNHDLLETIETDVLIVGAGLAALRAAVEAVDHGARVTVITKGIAGRAGSSAITSAGFSVAIGEADPADSPEIHYKDTVRGGGDINNRDLARIFCEEAPARFWEMVSWGVEFARDERGKYVQHKSGDHTVARVAVAASHKGTSMTLPLKQLGEGVDYLDRVMALDLMQDAHGVSGVVGIDTRDLKLVVIKARVVILGTGGVGALYPVTSNPNDVTGDGIALAYRAGAVLSDLEFVQFYPWRLISHVRSRMPVQPSSFASGARLRNSAGDRFMHKYDAERHEATTRDFAARGIYTEIIEGRGIPLPGGEARGVVLDLREIPLETFCALNPRVAKFFEERNLDLLKEQLLLAPEAHYHMGGVRIDEWGQTSLPWLYAAGEVSAGIHGGNRLDSNEISAGQVFGRRSGMHAARVFRDRPEPQPDEAMIAHWRERVAVLSSDALPQVAVKAMKDAIRQSNWRGAGIIRNASTIAEGIASSTALSEQLAASRPANLGDLPEFFEAENMAQTGRLIMQAASLRTESRSAHYREDFPMRNDEAWLVNVDVARATDADKPVLTRRMVVVAEAGTA